MASRLTPDQILDHIHLLAKEGEGADKRWALKQLSAETDALAFEKPKTEEEIYERIKRLLHGIGIERSKDCFRRAFPIATPMQWTEARKRGKTYVPIRAGELIEMFPECPVDNFGDPIGYPMKGSALVKKRWIADKAVELANARKASEQVKDPLGTRED